MKDLWAWISNLDALVKALEQNNGILVKNNNYSIEKDEQVAAYISQSMEKDKEHDMLIQSIRNVGKAVASPQQSEATV